jgi:hypothetical protein
MNDKVKMAAAGVIIVLLALVNNSCGLMQQVTEVQNLTKCDFRIESVNNLQLAGIGVQNIENLKQLNLFDAGKLTTEVLSGNPLPLDFIMNVEAKNPNARTAGLSKMEWILLIDDVEMTQGLLSQSVTIPGNGSLAVIPIGMHFDLRQALSGKSANAILNFVMNLSGSGNAPTRFKMKIRPSILIGNYPVTYPGYITIGHEFGQNNNTN